MVETEKIIEVVKRTKPFFRDREAVGNIRVKGLADYATQVDDGVQKFLAEELKKMYPDIGFLGEESYAGEQVSGRMWIVDPVDGTTNLIHHYRQSVVSVALASEGEIVFGIIYHPYTEELYCAEAGKGAYKNGVPIHVSPVKELSHSLIAVGTSPYYHEYAADNFAVFQKIFLQCEDIRRSGSAALLKRVYHTPTGISVTKAQKCPALAIPSGWYIMNNNADRGLRGTGQEACGWSFSGRCCPCRRRCSF